MVILMANKEIELTTLIFFKKDFMVYSRRKPDKAGKIICKMALIGKACSYCRVKRRSSLPKTIVNQKLSKVL